MAKVAIIGAGPAGVFCAHKLLESNENLDITLFDKDSPLLTILPTGNGRCNLAYGEFDPIELSKFYPRGEKFLYSVFSRYSTGDTISDFEKLGIKTYMQDDYRFFPESNRAKNVREALLASIKNKVKFKKEELTVIPSGYDAVVVACGLKNGTKLIETTKHKIVPIKPALCGLKIKEKEFLSLEGVSFNNVIFTKNGVSGPFIYKLSSINAYKNFPYEIKIPLVDTEILTQKIKENPKKLFKTIVSEFIPKSLANLIIKNEKQCANVSKKEIEELQYLILTATGTDGKGEIVHAGGVSLDEIDKNFKSKLENNLWFIGEVLDIDGFTGGFNLQLCWSSASIAAEDIIKKLK